MLGFFGLWFWFFGVFFFEGFVRVALGFCEDYAGSLKVVLGFSEGWMGFLKGAFFEVFTGIS